MNWQVASTEAVLSLLYARESIDEKAVIEASKNGIYIGKLKNQELPFFLDFSQLINPHIFACGVTGSGKTYFLKALLLRLGLEMQAEITCIDFTGEYEEQAQLIPNMNYIGMGSKSEDEKREIANKALKDIASAMRRKGIGKSRHFVFLDEAWKVLNKGIAFNTLLREGRKYGVGLVIASQLLEDLPAPLLGNIASLFVFRMQSSASIERLIRSYALTQAQAMEIASLQQGSAFALQIYKAKNIGVFEICRAEAVKLPRMARIAFGDDMYIEVDVEKLEAVLTEHMGSEKAKKVMKNVESGSISIDALLFEMLSEGLDRLKALHALRMLGINDIDIADAFAKVVQ
ncbi:MAG: helicase HerA domain-containing protein [Candidatus Micrarchaeia archaeon]